jgi:hypothetical protein
MSKKTKCAVVRSITRIVWAISSVRSITCKVVSHDMTTYTAAKSTGKYDRVDKMILERTRTINEFV